MGWAVLKSISAIQRGIKSSVPNFLIRSSYFAQRVPFLSITSSKLYCIGLLPFLMILVVFLPGFLLYFFRKRAALSRAFTLFQTFLQPASSRTLTSLKYSAGFSAFFSSNFSAGFSSAFSAGFSAVFSATLELSFFSCCPSCFSLET